MTTSEIIAKHNATIATVNNSMLPLLQHGIKKVIYLKLLNNEAKAQVISNVHGAIELFDNLGKFSDIFYDSMQKANINYSRNFLWPTQPNEQVGLALQAMNLVNGMSIIQKGETHTNTIAFIGDKHDTRLTDLFLNEQNMFYEYINKFEEQIVDNLAIDHNSYINFKCTKDELLLVNKTRNRYYLSGKYSEIYLSPRERLCVSLLANGKIYKEIADDMQISINTVKKHIDAVKLKIRILRKSELIKILRSMGAIQNYENF